MPTALPRTARTSSPLGRQRRDGALIPARACCVAPARRGFGVGLTWHSDEANLESAVDELCWLGVRVEHRRADFENVPGADAVGDELAEALGGVDAFVGVNAVAPGEIATKMTGNEDVDPSGEERPGIPAGRRATPTR
jgi:NAD(P)-dependent dehydrogenase (short-subunit alcohol dehydrogenase family)